MLKYYGYYRKGKLVVVLEEIDGRLWKCIWAGEEVKNNEWILNDTYSLILNREVKKYYLSSVREIKDKKRIMALKL